MNRTFAGLLFLLGFGLSSAGAQVDSDAVEPMLEVRPAAIGQTNSASVAAVYGIDSKEYLPTTEVARQHLRLQRRQSSLRPSFDLPDMFYFIGGPILIIVLLRVLVMFLNEFEEKRKEEMRIVASEEVPRDGTPID